MNLYETNVVYHTPLWNRPNKMKFSIGDRVYIFNGRVGIINSCLPAPSTSSMRCSDHCYYVLFEDTGRELFSENDLFKFIH